MLGEAHWLKLPTLARHHSNYLHELYFKTGGPSKEHRTSHHQWMNLKEVKRRRPVSSVQFSSIASDSLWPHGLQHARLPCPSPTPRACSNSRPLSQWCHPAISSCCHLLLLPSIFPSIWVFSNESVLPIRWPKDWSFSFSISPSNEYSGLISFRIHWILQSNGLSIVFSNTTVQKHQFFCAQLSL